MPAEKPIMLGIDLGTTNTCVAYVRNKVARVVPSDKGSLILPSVVAMSEKGDLLVGNVAKDQMVVNPRNTIYGAKRLIGRQYNSKVVQDIKHYFSYEIVEGPNGEAAVVLAGKVSRCRRSAHSCSSTASASPKRRSGRRSRKRSSRFPPTTTTTSATR